MSDLDRILQNDDVIRPSSGFAARVMDRVRREATAPDPIEFPWRRFLPGAISGAALVLIVLMFTVMSIDAPSGTPEATTVELPGWLSPAVLQEPVAIAVVALLGSLALAWAAVRLTTRPGNLSF